MGKKLVMRASIVDNGDIQVTVTIGTACTRKEAAISFDAFVANCNENLYHYDGTAYPTPYTFEKVYGEIVHAGICQNVYFKRIALKGVEDLLVLTDVGWVRSSRTGNAFGSGDIKGSSTHQEMSRLIATHITPWGEPDHDASFWS